MCNLYSQTKSQDAMRHLFDDMVEGDEELVDSTGNLPPQPGIWPDYPAPIIRHGESAAWQLAIARWGMPLCVFENVDFTNLGPSEVEHCKN